MTNFIVPSSRGVSRDALAVDARLAVGVDRYLAIRAQYALSGKVKASLGARVDSV
jgi:hypothetical protein